MSASSSPSDLNKITQFEAWVSQQYSQITGRISMEIMLIPLEMMQMELETLRKRSNVASTPKERDACEVMLRIAQAFLDFRLRMTEIQPDLVSIHTSIFGEKKP